MIISFSASAFACKIGELKPLQLETGKSYEMVVHKGQEFYYPEESPTTVEYVIYDRKKDKVMVKFAEPLPIQKRKVKIWFGKHSQAFYFDLNMQPRMADSEDIFYRIKLRHKGKDAMLWVRIVDTKGGCAQPQVKKL